MKKFGIVGAMEVEIATLLKNIENLSQEKVGGQLFHLGTYQNKEVIVTCSGIGKVNAAITAQTLVSHFQVDAIINTGIAGNMSSDLKIGDVVISETVTYHDFNLEFLQRYYPFVTHFKADPHLISAVESTLKTLSQNTFTYTKGLIVTGDIFLEDTTLKNALKDKFSPLCIEMEGAAIAHCAARNDIPFVIIRSISDTADDDAKEIYDNFETIVANRCATIVLNLLKTL